jgi:hypothetical protein
MMLRLERYTEDWPSLHPDSGYPFDFDERTVCRTQQTSLFALARFAASRANYGKNGRLRLCAMSTPVGTE